MLPFQTDAAITPPLNNNYGSAVNYGVNSWPAIGFYLTGQRQLLKLGNTGEVYRAGRQRKCGAGRHLRAVTEKADHSPASRIDSSLAGISGGDRGCAVFTFRE